MDPTTHSIDRIQLISHLLASAIYRSRHPNRPTSIDLTVQGPRPGTRRRLRRRRLRASFCAAFAPSRYRHIYTQACSTLTDRTAHTHRKRQGLATRKPAKGTDWAGCLAGVRSVEHQGSRAHPHNPQFATKQVAAGSRAVKAPQQQQCCCASGAAAGPAAGLWPWRRRRRGGGISSGCWWWGRVRAAAVAVGVGRRRSGGTSTTMMRSGSSKGRW